MGEIEKFIESNHWVWLLIIVAAMVLILKIIYQVLKTAKVSAFQNKSFFESFFYLLFKKTYMERSAKRASSQNMYFKAGQIYEEIGEFKKALQVYEEGQEYRIHGRVAGKTEQGKRSDRSL